jgi:hypothetical protein
MPSIGEMNGRRKADHATEFGWLESTCIRCGYDLRGHEHGHSRCPECGKQGPNIFPNSVDKATLRKVFLRLHTPLTLCVAAQLGVSVGVLLISLKEIWLGLGAFLSCLLLWILGSIHIGRKSKWKIGWYSAFVRYTFAVELYAVAFAGIVVGTYYLQANVYDRSTALVAVALILSGWVLRWAHIDCISYYRSTKNAVLRYQLELQFEHIAGMGKGDESRER